MNQSAGYAAGATTITVSGFSGAVLTDSLVAIQGDSMIHEIIAHSETAGNTTSITISPGLDAAVINGATVTVVSPGQFSLVLPSNLAAGNHTVQINYLGDTNYNPSASATSFSFTVHKDQAIAVDRAESCHQRSGPNRDLQRSGHPLGCEFDRHTQRSRQSLPRHHVEPASGHGQLHGRHGSLQCQQPVAGHAQHHRHLCRQ